MITKDESMRLKGVAILMMLFLHLFNTGERIDLCTPLLCVGKYPLAHLLSRIGALCVPIYIFLSGCGLHYVYQQTEGKNMRRGNRILRLYTNYWIIFLLFIPLACWVNPAEYPESLTTLLLNFTALSYSYNEEWWFLLPYMVLVGVCPSIIRLVHRLNVRQTLCCGLALMVLYLALEPLRGLIPLFPGKDFLFSLASLLFPFFAGIASAYRHSLSRFRSYVEQHWGGRKNLYLWTTLAVFLLLRVVIKTGSLNAVYGVIFIFLFTATDRTSIVNSILAYFGGHSTNMWLTHTFFSWYLFAEYVYGLHYPPLIFAALVAISLATSYVVRALYTPLQKRIVRLPF